MKVTLEFNKPEDNEEIAIHMQASNMYIAIQELDDWLRSCVKYEEVPEEHKEHIEIYSTFRDKLWKIMEDNDVKLHL